MSLDADLARPHLAFYAVVGNKRWSRVYPRGLHVDEETILPAQRYEVGDVRKPAVVYVPAAFRPRVECSQRHFRAELLLIPPAAMKRYDSTTDEGCKDVERTGPALAPVPPVIEKMPSVREEHPLRDKGSTYHCWTTAYAGAVQTGQGELGCYFVLRDPVTKRPKPHARYVMTWSGKGGRESTGEFKGVTDAQGRTAYLRSSIQFWYPNLRISEVVMANQLREDQESPWVSASRHVTFARPRGTQFVSRGGYPLSGYRYFLQLCNGKTHHGVTDDLGWPIYVEMDEGQPCPVRFVVANPW